MKRKNIYVEKSRQQTKMIMNKFEVLQNNQISTETDTLIKINVDIRKISEKIQTALKKVMEEHEGFHDKKMRF